MSFRSNPLSASPTRALTLQQYLLLHSEHESLRLSLAAYPIDTLSSYPATTYPSTPYSVATAAAYDADARKLHDVNQQIKSALTELLNCESVRGDRLYRAWVQRRLMEAEMELKEGRRMSAGGGRRMSAGDGGSMEGFGEVRVEEARA
ncbi:hypothetical protein VC83_03114 [Pseudogymnoascus destructans]|uniref:Uncharacterized protein n=2 Tax=Pseudogymnoascus destructans TaxID=655981 RepID=L8FUL8_PSED2|nr:uncharacterized protein VC83_03114 [Pseudogymnoascus destructans]ELR04572.1 hypothetical protein GMDG_06856 [Pseudogymnoascus destructans 20631-21]OAF60250.1 hypothetical protein VC83_03114 [Pseudogymnoascus destructans]